ncbi:MAG TPA: helix-turn-helix domain-containing protein [Candidatus Flavonifractor merdigallinarum]|uniref:Helix-turn-helix domain-containing protein n=1 Tax=Candidatus Flavonifractor merdigallinarum TaxID=2838589 RepID=A0A9D2BYQ3_9FIRM|nr:helix-turn-helix domain-containing protein [Candidatus Flavonifractor merdigallinarum]
MRNLKAYRTHIGKTQKEVADYLGIERSTYAKYENGSSEPTFDTLRRLSEYFNTSIDELMGFEETRPVPPTMDKAAIKAAFWGGEKDLSQEELDDMWNDVERFAAFLAEKKRQEKGHD